MTDLVLQPTKCAHCDIELTTAPGVPEPYCPNTECPGAAPVAATESAEVPVQKVQQRKWTTESALLAALVHRAGGRMRITQKQIEKISALSITADPLNGDILVFTNRPRGK